MADQEREKPVHSGVIFVEINKGGYCRVSGYTGNKDDGDQNMVLNISAKDPVSCSRAGGDMLGDIVVEMFRVHAELTNATLADRKVPTRRRAGK